MDLAFFRISFIILTLYTFFSLPLSAQNNTVQALHPMQVDQDFDITESMSNPVWQQASSVFIKHEVMPDDQALAPVETKVKVLYSKNYLYIGFMARDPQPSNIRAQITERDKSFQDDYVGVFIDPFNNNQQAYALFVNPRGIQMDGMRTGNKEDMNFDMLWYSAGSVTDSGFVATMKVPFKSLSFPERRLQDWSIQFMRNYPRSKRHQLAWTDVSTGNSCLMCQNGTLAGMKGIESSNTVELLPYVLGSQGSALVDNEQPASGLDHGPLEGRIGGSMSYRPNSTLSLEAVINPDFSQVETDAAQISANETFALYYSEKRPFFMKGADLFTTRENLFYSRMINHPFAAGKLTQKTGSYSLAFMTAYDRGAPFIVPGLTGSSPIRSDREAYNNVLRTKYNFGSESYVGGLLTTRNQGKGANYVGGFDWRLLVADHYYFNGQVALSDTKELNDMDLFDESRAFGRSDYDAAFNGEHYTGSLVSTSFTRESKHYNFSLEYSSFSPTFQTHSGFVNRTDRRQFEAEQSISYYPQLQWLYHGSFWAKGIWRYDFAGQFQERLIIARLQNNLGGQTRLYINYLPMNDEYFRGTFFTRLHRTSIGLNSNALDVFSLGAKVGFGRYIYRTDNPSLGQGYNISLDATVKPTTRLQLMMDYSFSTLSSVDRSENYYSGSIFRLNSRYNFTRKLFARVIVQYNSFGEQLQVYPLLYYQVNPFTKFYIGMTDYMDRYDEVDNFQGLQRTNRQFFVKFQYLIRS